MVCSRPAEGELDPEKRRIVSAWPAVVAFRRKGAVGRVAGQMVIDAGVVVPRDTRPALRDRTYDGQMVGNLGREWQVLADVYARYRSLYWLELAAKFDVGIGLQVKGIDM